MLNQSQGWNIWISHAYGSPRSSLNCCFWSTQTAGGSTMMKFPTVWWLNLLTSWTNFDASIYTTRILKGLCVLHESEEMEAGGVRSAEWHPRRITRTWLRFHALVPDEYYSHVNGIKWWVYHPRSASALPLILRVRDPIPEYQHQGRVRAKKILFLVITPPPPTKKCAHRHRRFEQPPQDFKTCWRESWSWSVSAYTRVRSIWIGLTNSIFAQGAKHSNLPRYFDAKTQRAVASCCCIAPTAPKAALCWPNGATGWLRCCYVAGSVFPASQFPRDEVCTAWQ